MVTEETNLILQSKFTLDSIPLAKQSTYKLRARGNQMLLQYKAIFSCYFWYDPLYREWQLYNKFCAFFNSI